MEKTITQTAQGPAKAQSAQADEIEALKRQREALERRLAEANSKLATARLSEKLDRDQQSERLQVLESPPLPQKPMKANRLKFVAIAFAAAAALGMGMVVASELLDGSIRSRQQLVGVVASPMIVSIPYIATRADTIKARWRAISSVVSVIVLLAALGGLAAAIVFHLPIELSSLEKAGVGFPAGDK